MKKHRRFQAYLKKPTSWAVPRHCMLSAKCNFPFRIASWPRGIVRPVILGQVVLPLLIWNPGATMRHLPFTTSNQIQEWWHIPPHLLASAIAGQLAAEGQVPAPGPYWPMRLRQGRLLRGYIDLIWGHIGLLIHGVCMACLQIPCPWATIDRPNYFLGSSLEAKL